MLVKTLIPIYSHFKHQLKKGCLALLSPYCLLCHYPTHSGLSICGFCRQTLPILPHHCQKCAQFIPAVAAEKAPTFCHRCHATPPPYDRTFALFPYQTPIAELIMGLKFGKQLPYAKALGELFIQPILEQWYNQQALPQQIIPIPLHPSRLRERGFNQSLEIARPIANALSIPIEWRHSLRTKPTLPQSTLNATARQENMQGAFHVTQSLAGLFIAVIDDVITTGHTMATFCQALKNKGAARIDVWCVARRGL